MCIHHGFSPKITNRSGNYSIKTWLKSIQNSLDFDWGTIIYISNNVLLPWNDITKDNVACHNNLVKDN